MPISDATDLGAAPKTGAPARRSRDDVVVVALRLLDDGGLAGLSMRNLAAALGVRPSALYWHFPNKQSILAAVSDAILDRADADADAADPAGTAEQADAFTGAPVSDDDSIGVAARRAAVVRAALEVRDALRSTADGAEVVASTIALGLGERRPETRIRAAMRGLAPDRADIAARTITTYLLGHTQQWQQRRFAEHVGLVEVSPGDERLAFLDGLDLLLDGVEAG